MPSVEGDDAKGSIHLESDKETTEETASHLTVDRCPGKGTELYVACFNSCCVTGDKLIPIKIYIPKQHLLIIIMK